ncbi:hypothetical protein FRX31_013393 [Thalictrum thalictroides]|uniref:Uncharacterized protein n=1 Tax=Thalictrum thalictroides TaxID=46969 RepID=A0A7J6WI26_THATH|nr:hypothetical protein FRX31_013393 [Thalictrum thalictroides]
MNGQQISHLPYGEVSSMLLVRLDAEKNGLSATEKVLMYGKIIGLGLNHFVNTSDLAIQDGKLNLNAKLHSCIQGGKWTRPAQLVSITVRLGLDITSIPLPNIECDDKFYWPFNTQGKLTTSSSFEAIREKGQVTSWCKFLWLAKVHPR